MKSEARLAETLHNTEIVFYYSLAVLTLEHPSPSIPI